MIRTKPPAVNGGRFFDEAMNFEDIIIGSMLGDGHIAKPRCKNTYFSKTQSLKHLEYLNWHFPRLLPYSSRISRWHEEVKGKVYDKCRFSTFSSELFTSLERKWYLRDKQGNYILNKKGHRIKIVPRDTKLNWPIVAIWYADDGYNYAKKGRLRLHTEGFNSGDVEFLIEELENLGIESYANYAGIIIVRPKCYLQFLDGTSQYFEWSCFKHKIDSTSYKPRCNFMLHREVSSIIDLYDQGCSVKEISEKLNLHQNPIYNVLKGKTFNKDKPNRKVALNNSSGTTGISWDKSRNKWIASIQINGKKKNLGRFNKKEDAIEARFKVESSVGKQK